VADPGARVAYVDSDPMVAAHGRALLASDPGVRAFRADFRDASAVLRKARELLDFASPVAIMFVASLHHLEDEDDPADVVAWYLQAAAPGSYLVLSHCTDDIATEGMRAVAKEARRRSATFVPRGRDAIWRMFNGCPLVEPGLVQVSYWRPDGLPGPDADRVPAYGGIARL
jgi:SAM-dependent methyltransferase